MIQKAGEFQELIVITSAQLPKDVNVCLLYTSQQGAFDLGYYHQTQKRYTKKEEQENG